MSRLGRGGGGIGARMRGQALPFDIDPELVEAADKSLEDEFEDDSDKEIFPDFGEFIMAAPVTEDERRGVQISRELDAKRRAGPFWTGTREDWAQIDALIGRSGVGHDPFEGAQTYGKKHTKRSFKLADFSKVKLDYRFFPKELWSTIGYSKKDAEDKEEENPEGRPAKRQKKLGLAKKSTLDKLAKFDEDHEDEPNAEADEDENEGGNEEEGEEFEREPEDDDFDEDDDDANNDYNAEAYFDGGEEDFEEQGGDEYGEDGY